VQGIKSYPYAIRGNGKGVYAINLGVTGVYNGIDFGSNPCDSHFVRKVNGTLYNNGILVGQSSAGWVESCLSNPAKVDRVGFGIPGWLTEADVFSVLINPVTRQNEQMITVNGASNEHILNICAYGAHDLIRVISGTVTIINCDSDNQGGNYTIRVEGGTVNAVNSMRHNGVANTYGVLISNNEMYM
jgi:hypothetical protein